MSYTHNCLLDGIKNQGELEDFVKAHLYRTLIFDAPSPVKSK
jgi:hypothetical protein